jgi:Spy/CpxP family protein refolding chaperone
MKFPHPLKHWKILLLMAGLFLAGLICGGVLTASAIGKAVVRTLSMEGWSRRTTRDLQQRLTLTPEQTQQIQAIAERYQPEVMDLRNDTFKRFGALHQRFTREIEPLLTPEQLTVLSNLNRVRTEKFLKTFKLASPSNAPPASAQPNYSAPAAK